MNKMEGSSGGADGEVVFVGGGIAEAGVVFGVFAEGVDAGAVFGEEVVKGCGVGGVLRIGRSCGSACGTATV
jgi:hypothetical protein